MQCPNCQAQIADTAGSCPYCHSQISLSGPYRSWTAGGLGFSSRINDPLFQQYIKSSNRWAIWFSLFLALLAVVGFYIAGEMGLEKMKNPQSLFIGIFLALLFTGIAFAQIIKKKRSKTWDGIVVDKKIKKKTRHDQDTVETYLEYRVIIRQDNGKKHVLKNLRSDLLYHYYNIGDRVRHHAGLNSIEKYDKSKDRYIPCNACGSISDINEDYCSKCKCPLLK